jgi:hypothetical protein
MILATIIKIVKDGLASFRKKIRLGAQIPFLCIDFEQNKKDAINGPWISS